MKASSISILKKELSLLPYSDVVDICMKLTKYKKENKELLTYLLFEANDEPLYIKKVKEFIDEQFEDINKSNSYFVKKTLRKILRITNSEATTTRPASPIPR